MRRLFIISLLLLTVIPLNADTELQERSEQAQNYLEWTATRISYAWEMMIYHFEEGTNRLNETSDGSRKTIKAKMDKRRNR